MSDPWEEYGQIEADPWEEYQQPDTLKAEEIPGAEQLKLPEGSTFGSFVAGVGSVLDYYGGAPVRNAIYKAIEDPEAENPIWEATKGFMDQYKKMPSEAPTGKDIAGKLGVPTQKGMAGVSPADVTGFLIDMGADWTNVVPGKQVASLGFKGLGKAAKPVSKLAVGATDVATGTRVPSTIAKTAVRTAEAGKESLGAAFGEVPIKTWESSKQIAKKLNIPEEQLPASVKFGKNSLTSLFEKYEREGPTGKKLMEWWEHGAGQLEKGITGEVRKFGVPKDMASAGAQMQGAVDKGLKRFFKGIDTSYDKILKKNPELMMPEKDFLALKHKLTRYRNEALKFDDHPVPEIRNKANQIKELIGRMDFGNQSADYWRGLQRDLGNVAFLTKYKSMADTPPDIKKIQRMYFDMEHALHGSIKQLPDGGNIVKELKTSNKKMSAMFKDKESIVNYMGEMKDPEKVWTTIMGGTRKIKALKKILAPEDLNKVKASYLENMIIQRADDDTIKWLGLSKRLRDADRKGVLNALFDSRELGAMRDFVKLSNRFGEKVLSTSGTGASNQITFLNYLKTTASKVGEELTVKPIRELVSGGGPEVAKTLPLFRTPKEYLQTYSSRMKGAQVYSVHHETVKRNREKEIIGEYHGVDLSKAPYNLVDDLIKKTKAFNEMKEGRMKALYKRNIDRLLRQYGGK
jgi:hypothetical protein